MKNSKVILQVLRKLRKISVIFFNLLSYLTGMPFFMSFEVFVTQKCNLKCRDCMACIPYYKKAVTLQTEELINNIQKVLKHVVIIFNLTLVGGETFLAKDLPEIIEFCSSQMKIRNITIITNGTIIPNNEYLQALAKKKVMVIISGYGKTSKKADELIALFNEYKIKYIYEENKLWTPWQEFYKRNYTVKACEVVYRNCHSRSCRLLYGDKLFTCHRMAHGERLGFLPIFEEDSVNIKQYEGKRLQKRIVKFLSKKSFEGCYYCDGFNEKNRSITGGIQI